MTDESEVNKMLWGLIGSVAGAITSLSFQSWRDMTRAEIMMSVFVSASFAFFVGPLVITKINDTRAAGAIFYLLATGSNVLIPRAVRWLTRIFDNGAGPESKP